MYIRQDVYFEIMKIGLIDVDGHNFPNFALMKISAYHKAQGDFVEWARPRDLFGVYEYDKIYASKIFTFSQVGGANLFAANPRLYVYYRRALFRSKTRPVPHL